MSPAISRSHRKFGLTTISVLVFCALLFPAQAQQTHFKSGETLGSNGYLVSKNKAFFAVVRSYRHNYWYGGFGVYKGSSPDMNLGQIWSVGKESTSANALSLSMQADANLCVYEANVGTAFWCKNFVAQPIGSYFAVMQDDGNLCIYKGTPEAQGPGIWCASSHKPITWDVNGKQFQFSGLGAYGARRTEALIPEGSGLISGTSSLTDTNSRWSAPDPQGRVRWAPDTGKCLTLNTDNALFLQACGGFPSQMGWYMQPGDQTFRKIGLETGCVYMKYDATNWRDSVPMPKKALMGVPCPTEEMKFTLK